MVCTCIFGFYSRDMNTSSNKKQTDMSKRTRILLMQISCLPKNIPTGRVNRGPSTFEDTYKSTYYLHTTVSPPTLQVHPKPLWNPTLNPPIWCFALRVIFELP